MRRCTKIDKYEVWLKDHEAISTCSDLQSWKVLGDLERCFKVLGLRRAYPGPISARDMSHILNIIISKWDMTQTHPGPRNKPLWSYSTDFVGIFNGEGSHTRIQNSWCTLNDKARPQDASQLIGSGSQFVGVRGCMSRFGVGQCDTLSKCHSRWSEGRSRGVRGQVWRTQWWKLSQVL